MAVDGNFKVFLKVGFYNSKPRPFWACKRWCTCIEHSSRYMYNDSISMQYGYVSLTVSE